MARHAPPRAPNLRLLFEPSARSNRSRRVIVLAYGTAFFALTTVSLLRQSGAPPTDTIWAEDGMIFYPQALTHSVLGALFTPYAGYLQLFPRLMFDWVSILPPADVAGAAAIVGAASLAALALFVFHASAASSRRRQGGACWWERWSCCPWRPGSCSTTWSKRPGGSSLPRSGLSCGDPGR